VSDSQHYIHPVQRHSEPPLVRNLPKCGSSKSWTVLHECLGHWLAAGSSTFPLDVSQYKILPPTSVLLHKAILEQSAIGWPQAMRGYLSQSWLHAQHSEFPNSTLKVLRHTWFRSIILELWNFYTTMWEHRNLVLHAQTAVAQQIKDSPIDARIQLLYATQETFAASDRPLFSLPLLARLKSSRRSKKHWLTLVQRYQPTTITRRNGDQPSLTRFFPRIFKSNSVSPECRSERITDLTTTDNVIDPGLKGPYTADSPQQSSFPHNPG
jgi:hypothetical protein